MARTKNRVTGVVVREGKVLMSHRFKKGEEYWVFPGGGVEDGETLEEGLRREMLEETCLEMEIPRQLRREQEVFGILPKNNHDFCYRFLSFCGFYSNFLFCQN